VVRISITLRVDHRVLVAGESLLGVGRDSLLVSMRGPTTPRPPIFSARAWSNDCRERLSKRTLKPYPADPPFRRSQAADTASEPRLTIKRGSMTHSHQPRAAITFGPWAAQ
jgi:hypothetical protein